VCLQHMWISHHLLTEKATLKKTAKIPAESNEKLGF